MCRLCGCMNFVNGDVVLFNFVGFEIYVEE